MKLINGIHNLSRGYLPCAATIGNFDGLHRGHQQIISELVALGRAHHLPTTLISFEPHPKEFFNTGQAPARLTRLREKLCFLQASALDQVLILKFNQALADLSAEHFIRHILVEELQVKCLIVGEDFRFGHRREGDIHLLKRLAQRYSFQVIAAPPVLEEDARISSSRVRETLSVGDLVLAEQLLGRPYSMCGRVIHGDKRGRTIGFPTANINLHRRASPLQGVYAVRIFGVSETPLFGVCNVGKRPTVSGHKILLEVHIFNFDQQIYGHYLQVEFRRKLRDEKKFASFAELKQQIAADAAQARHYFHL